jgi:hypothetical protein
MGGEMETSSIHGAVMVMMTIFFVLSLSSNRSDILGKKKIEEEERRVARACFTLEHHFQVLLVYQYSF